MGIAELAQLKILVVDDHQDVLRATHTLLTGKGYAVVTATKVSEALRQIISQHFDVLVTDLHMPAPDDGFAVVTAMGHTQRDALTVVVSGFPDLPEAMAAILLQADEILIKPWNSKKLAELIQKHTGVRQPAARMRDSVAECRRVFGEFTGRCAGARGIAGLKPP
jgi:DNA-binding NtrC family response regulator